MKFYFDDPDYDGQYARTLGKTAYGCAEVGECVAVADQITPVSDVAWYAAWSAMAQRLESEADHAAGKRHSATASEKYLRAAEYYWRRLLLTRGVTT